MKLSPGTIGKVLLWLMVVSLTLPLCTAYAEDELDASRKRLEQLQNQIRTTLEGLQKKQSERPPLVPFPDLQN